VVQSGLDISARDVRDGVMMAVCIFTILYLGSLVQRGL
jgi:hypothetical protein